MAAPIKPALKQSLGKEAWGFVPAIAAIATPTVGELTATGGFNLSCSVFSDQAGITSSTNKVSLPRLLCEMTAYQVNGETTYEMADLMISMQPQAASGSDGKKAWETLTDGIAGFLWHRQDVLASTDVTAGQFVDIIPVQLGVKTPTTSGNDDSAVYAFTQPAAVTGKPAFNVAVVAGS